MMFTSKEQTFFQEGNKKLTLIKIISSWPFLVLLPTIRNLEERKGGKKRSTCQKNSVHIVKQGTDIQRAISSTL